MRLLDYINLKEGFVNTKDKNLTKDEINKLSVGSEFYYNGFSVKKISDTKVKIKYPMKPNAAVPINSLKAIKV